MYRLVAESTRAAVCQLCLNMVCGFHTLASGLLFAWIIVGPAIRSLGHSPYPHSHDPRPQTVPKLCSYRDSSPYLLSLSPTTFPGGNRLFKPINFFNRARPPDLRIPLFPRSQ